MIICTQPQTWSASGRGNGASRFFFFFSNWDGAPPRVGALSKLCTLHIGSGGTDLYRPRYRSYRTHRTSKGQGLEPPRLCTPLYSGTSGIHSYNIEQQSWSTYSKVFLLRKPMSVPKPSEPSCCLHSQLPSKAASYPSLNLISNWFWTLYIGNNFSYHRKSPLHRRHNWF